jgi:hypothetical protein
MGLFKEFLQEATIRASGSAANDHAKKYITPYLPKGEKHTTGSHTLAKAVHGHSAGTAVTLISHTVEGDKHYVTVSAGKDKFKVLANKLNKPVTKANRGFEQEAKLADHLRKHGLMEGEAAGFTAGNDFHLIDKRGHKKKKIRGSEGFHAEKHKLSEEKGIQGEHKSDIRTTAFGQITISRHPKTQKWYISDEARAKRPEYAAAVEKATVTVGGKTKSLLQHLNDTEPPGTSNKTGFHSDETTLHPAHAYMRDHHVDIVHIDSHGTYRAGMSETRDRHKLGLPVMQGVGRFRVRQKQTYNNNSRTAQFSIKKLEKSDINIGTDEGAIEMKKRLGHQ